jgi:hypothetical protein
MRLRLARIGERASGVSRLRYSGTATDRWQETRLWSITSQRGPPVYRDKFVTRTFTWCFTVLHRQVSRPRPDGQTGATQ